MPPSHLSVTEYAVLGILDEGPSHGFAIARLFAPEGEVGRVITVRRPLIYRALDRLAVARLTEPIHAEPGDAGPQRIIHRITPNGRRRLNRWLRQPVQHVREMRIEFLLKLTLLQRAGRSPLALISAQKAALHPTLAALEAPGGAEPNHVELWRRHNALAAAGFLDDLERAWQRGF
ncbi:MAG TPA: PadR family transcriptional regulator [Acidimicrobiia bacterium]|nr:PadR family transcriptional regulator [Acidimicrobiia bacterium]